MLGYRALREISSEHNTRSRRGIENDKRWLTRA